MTPATRTGRAGQGGAARLLARLPAAERERLRSAEDDPPAGRPPMLATLSSRRGFDDRWVFERKLDGVRALAVREPGGTARLLSRTGRPIGVTYPEVVEALAARGEGGMTLDGEIVALRDGRTDFGLLQQRLGLTNPVAVRASPVVVTYYVFDLLELEGLDLTRLPLRTRKSLLRAALSYGGPLRFTPHRNHDAERGAADLLADACARGWEGLIAKRADSRYQHRRSGDWLKLKCERGQEFVIGGFTEPAGARTGFGALLLGYYDEAGGLRYAGKVGTGWSHEDLRTLRAVLDTLERPRSPFAAPPRERGAHWVEPRLVAQVGFGEWTRDGLLRHPRFLGLRDDKAPADVVRERPA